MQTFLPYSGFKKSVRVLDNKRLGKQRVETLQLLKALAIPGYGWRNHPACKMWHGCAPALAEYGLVVCAEWKRRGFRDTCEEKIQALCPQQPLQYPAWLGNYAFHRSHRSNLLRKNSSYYRTFWPKLTPALPYIWPI